MNKYLKEFLFRGLIFGGFGPILLGIIYWILSYTISGFSIQGGEACLGIVSIYFLAFIQAGASVFNQIEEWGIGKSLLFHFLTLFIAYSGCYIINTWIPFEPMVLLIFAAIFIVVYFAVWFTVYFIGRATRNKLNRRLSD